MSYRDQWKSIIRYAEGTDSPEGYQTTFSYGQPVDLSAPHPGRVNRSGGYASSASGAYQFLITTWKDVWGGQNRPMTPQNQDEAAVKLMLRRGVNPDRDPLTRENVAKLAPEWASLPTLEGKSYYGQPVKAYDDLMKRAGRQAQEGANLPQAATTPAATPQATPSPAAPKGESGFMDATLAGIKALGGDPVEGAAVKAQFAQGPEFATQLNALGDTIIEKGANGSSPARGSTPAAPKTDGMDMMALAAIRSLTGSTSKPEPQAQQAQQPGAQAPAPQPAQASSGGLRRIGRIADPKEDVFPTTGAHLDVRIQRPDGSYINPEEGRSMLTEVTVGGKPLFSQGADGTWQSAAPITSRFGPRDIGVGSKNHMGLDLGVAAGTELHYSGAGNIRREHGMYVIDRPDGHRLKLLHTI